MTRTPALLALLCLLSLACRSRITGNEGNFQFSYAADDDVADFTSPSPSAPCSTSTSPTLTSDSR